MTFRIADRVLETSTSTGTGEFSLSGAVTGYQRFSEVDGIQIGDTCRYTIFEVSGGNPSGAWETGLGTYSSANTLTRTTVEDSSNSGSAVNFGAGDKYVMLTVTADLFEDFLPAWVANFTDDGETRFYADKAMTVSQQATSGTGTVAYEKSTGAAPGTFSSTSSPVALEAGAWLKIAATDVTDFFAVSLKRAA